MRHKLLRSVDQIVSALGGRVSAAELFAIHPNAVDHWLNAGLIPCHLYPAILRAVNRKGFTVGFDLFRWNRAATPKRSKRNRAA